MKELKLGFVFSEQLGGVKEPFSEFAAERLRFFWFAFFFIFVGLTVRLFWLQVIEGQRNRILSEENRILARRIQAPRGIIIDRNGEVLAQNIPVYKIKNKDCEPAESNCSEFVEISRDEALRLEASGRSEEVLTLVGRHYLFGPEIAHLVGYVGEVDPNELRERADYELGDLIGKLGVEFYYDELLHGRDGAELVEIDAAAQVVREVAKKESVSGVDLTLTVDSNLQKKAYGLMGDYSGALVALDPTNGEVLTLVSKPSFDPNEVAVSLGREEQPFFNRAIGGLYPPGSVFKVVTATGGLEEGEIDANTEFEDTGEIRIGSYRYGNWYFDQYGRKEGFLDIVGAIRRSNDIFFYRVGELLGATRLSEWAKMFGYGRATEIGLPGEAHGLVPSPLWKEREKGERWFLGNTYHFAIGQADLEVTPLQVAQMTAVIANGGKLCRPHVNLVGDDKLVCEDLGISQETLRLVSEGMREACLPRGTAFPFFDFGVMENGEFRRIEVGCKTGTAEYGDPQGRTHAWFTVFAPSEEPQIVVTVLLEGAGEGSYQAAPVAREFLEYYFGEIRGLEDSEFE